ncbi:MAG: site-specific integrase [Flavobacteriia bacterium]
MKLNVNQSFSILYWLYKSKAKNGKAPIYCRIVVDGKRTEIATKKWIEPDKWNSSFGSSIGKSEEARSLNSYLETLKSDIQKHCNILISLGEIITPDKIKNSFLGKVEKQKTLMDVFKYHNDTMKEKIGIDLVKSTHTKFETVYKKLQEFLKKKYNVRDIHLSELNNKLVVDFEHYLKVNENIGHNTAMKYIRNLKKVMNMCVGNDWLVKNPFLNFKCTNRQVNREVLNQAEITSIIEKEFETDRLNEVRDIFLFCCYTGFSFIDVSKLTSEELEIGIDGRKWIFTNRQKTGNQSNVPLLPPAEEIIKKYENHICREYYGKLLPVKSNQKMNEYLKEIAGLCKIKKKLTMHIARHTFATTITLSNGVPMETVSKMLGHTKLATTQIYAKVLETKVSHDMNILSYKMFGKKQSKASLRKAK